VLLALIPVRAPKSKLAQAALMELRLGCDLFEKAALHGGRAVKMLPIIRRHLQKATHNFQTARTQLTVAPEIFPAPSRDEFAVFSGITHTVSTRTKPQPPRLQMSRSASSIPSEASSGLPSSVSTVESEQRQGAAVDQQAWGEAHRTLVDQLVTFDGTLDEQINSTGWQFGYGSDSAGGPGEADGSMDNYNYAPPEHEYSHHHPQPTYDPSMSASMHHTQSHSHHLPPESSYSTLITSPPSDEASRLDHSSYSPATMAAPSYTPEDVDTQKLWSVPHNELAYARPRTPPAQARDRVLRQSGDLSLTEAWTTFMSQMDIPMAAGAKRAV